MAITALQAIAFSINLIATSPQAIIIGQFGFTISSVIVLTAGTVFVMWLGERISDRGIGKWHFAYHHDRYNRCTTRKFDKRSYHKS